MTERYIGRAHEWWACDSTGAWHREADHASLSNLPADLTIVALAAVGERRHVVYVPDGATPVCFWRVSLEVETGNRSAITVIGWERDGTRSLLWVHDDGTVEMTDRDRDDL